MSTVVESCKDSPCQHTNSPDQQVNDGCSVRPDVSFWCVCVCVCVFVCGWICWCPMFPTHPLFISAHPFAHVLPTNHAIQSSHLVSTIHFIQLPVNSILFIFIPVSVIASPTHISRHLSRSAHSDRPSPTSTNTPSSTSRAVSSTPPHLTFYRGGGVEEGHRLSDFLELPLRGEADAASAAEEAQRAWLEIQQQLNENEFRAEDLDFSSLDVDFEEVNGGLISCCVSLVLF